MTATTIRLMTSALIAATALGLDPGISGQPTCDIVVVGGVYFNLRDESIDPKCVYRVASDGAGYEPLYTTTGNLVDVALSPQCHYVACREALEGQRTLHLVDLNGNVELRLPGVYRYSWAPDGESIAYIDGTKYEGGIGFRPIGVWVYEVDNGLARKVPCTGYDLAWAEHDGNLYVLSSGPETGVEIYQYNPRTNETKKTAHHGIFFSPNGKRSYLPSYEGSLFGLYVTDSDTNLAKGIACFGPLQIFGPRGWLNNSILIGPSRTGKVHRDTLVNIETDTQCVLPGEVISFPIEGDTFKMWHDGKITEVSLDSLTFTPPEESRDE